MINQIDKGLFNPLKEKGRADYFGTSRCLKTRYGSSSPGMRVADQDF
jgi:hypothetical protein